MRILHYGDFRSPSCPEFWISVALTEAGHLCWRESATSTSPGELATRAREVRAELVLLHKPERMHVQDVVKIKREAGALVVLWTFDWRREPRFAEWYEPLAKVADLTLATDGPEECAYWNERGCRSAVLRQGAWPAIHHPDARRPTYDVAFIGSLYTERRKEIDRLLRRRFGDRYLYRGNGTPEAEHGEVWGRDFREAVASARVVVGDNWTNDVPGYWSDRVYLTLACGGFFLASWVKGIDREFEIGKHLAVYENVEALVPACERALARPDVCDATAERGRHEVMTHHTYAHRARDFTREIERLKT